MPCPHHARHRGIALLLTALLVVSAAVVAQQPADPMARLEAARDTYDQALDKARTRFLANIDKRIDDAKKAGRLDQIDQYTAQKGDFIATGTLPQAPGLQPDVSSYGSDQRNAARLFLVTIKATESALTKADRLDEARQVQQERIEVEARFNQENGVVAVADPAELLQPNSVWRGYAQAVKAQKGEGKRVGNLGLSLRITERNGDFFKGLFRGDGGMSAEIQGGVGKNEQTRYGTFREINFTVTRRIGPDAKGPVGPATTHYGMIRGGSMDLTLPAFRQGASVVAAKVQFQLQSGSR